MSELLITYHSADEIIVAEIIKRLNELGIETTSQTISNESSPTDASPGLRLVCWSPSAIVATTVSADQWQDIHSRIDCLVAPCDLASHSKQVESLVGWNGAVEAPEWLALIAHIASNLQRPGLIEASRALASGDKKERYGFAKRYPDEPLARNIWKHRETKYRQAFEHSIAFARANFDRRVRTNWKRIEDMLKVHKTEFELWLEAERIGNAHAIPHPRLLTGDIDDDFDRTGEAEAKAAMLADQLAREYSRRRELSDRATRLEQQLNQSQAEATLRLQMATRALEGAHSKAQMVEREHAAVVVERNLLNHGLAALRGEVERLRPSPRRFRILVGTMMSLAIAAGTLASHYWPSAAGQSDPSSTSSIMNMGRLATKSPTTILTKENVSGVVTDALRIAPASVVATLLARTDLFEAAQPNDLLTLAARLAKVAPHAAIAEIVSARPLEVMAETLKTAPEIAVSETVTAAAEAALREILMKNPNMAMSFVVANAPIDAMAELLRGNSKLLTAVARQPKLLSELVRTAPDATIDDIVGANPRGFATRLISENADEIISEIVKKQFDKTASELFRTDSNELVARVVRNDTDLAAAELVKANPNAAIAALLQRDPDKALNEAARTVPNALIAEVLRSDLPTVARQAIKVAPAALIAELIKERPADFAAAMATNYPDTTIANPEALRPTDTPQTDALAALRAANLTAPAEPSPIPADGNGTPPKPAGKSNGSLKPNQPGVTNEVVAQVSTEIVRNIVNQVSPKELTVVTSPAASPASSSLASTRRDYAVIQDCDLCPKLVTIPKGANLVGLRGDERLSRDISDRSVPSRMVTIANPFALSESKITVAQFKAFMMDKHHGLEPSTKSCRNAAGRALRDQEVNYLAPGFAQADTHPVVCVSWNDAIEYTRWLSEKTGKRYRLPTESEWEYSARAARSEPWRVADSLTDSCKFGNILDSSAVAKKAGLDRPLAATCSDEWPYTSPAGAFAANEFGLFDMYGNAHEWVQDCWNDQLSDLPADGGARNGENGSAQCANEMRVRRGSAWTTPPSSSGLAARWKGTATHAFQDTGFRVLRELN